jgi:hypothetical protein
LFNHLKTKVKCEITKAKLEWGLRAKRSSKDLWRVVNISSGRKDNSLNSVLGNFDSVESAANAMNSFFASVFTQADANSCTTQINTMNVSDIGHLTVTTVYHQLLKLKIGKAPGPGDIPVLLYKKAAVFLSEPLTHLFNVCLTRGQFPTSWKLAHIIPIPKSPKPDINELRPISLLATLSKVFEKILANSVLENIKHYSGREQHGGLPGRSTVTASILVHDHVTRLLETENVDAVQVISYDITKAFDKLSHSIIIRRLTECHFPRNFITLVESYL